LCPQEQKQSQPLREVRCGGKLNERGQGESKKDFRSELRGPRAKTEACVFEAFRRLEKKKKGGGKMGLTREI